MSLDHEGYRNTYQRVDGKLNVLAATDDTTLVAAKNAAHTIYIQKYHVQVTGASATTWTLEDTTAVTTIPVSGALSVATAPLSYERDFGARGCELGAGKNFVLNVGAAGASGVITWEGYQRVAENTSVALASY